MAHFAIQLGNLTVELEDEDMGAKAITKLGESVFSRLVDRVNEEGGDDGE